MNNCFIGLFWYVFLSLRTLYFRFVYYKINYKPHACQWIGHVKEKVIREKYLSKIDEHFYVLYKIPKPIIMYLFQWRYIRELWEQYTFRLFIKNLIWLIIRIPVIVIFNVACLYWGSMVVVNFKLLSLSPW